MKTLLICFFAGILSLSAAIAQNSSTIGVKMRHSDEFATLTFKITNEDQNSITIRPTSKYFDKYISNKIFEINYCVSPGYGDTENDEYPEIDCFIVNNSNKSIVINSLDINVESSLLDYFPYIYIGTPQDYSNCIYFLNESWTNWGQMTFKYKILIKGEEFNGQYEKQMVVPNFNDKKIVNLLPDLIAKGYNYDAIRNAAIKDGIYFESENNAYLGLYRIEKKYFQKYKDLFKPFEIESDYGGDSYSGFARIYGEITFSNSTHKIAFVGKLSLSTEGGFGAGMYEDGKYSIKLSDNRQNYVIRYPYNTTLKPGGSERVRVKFMAPKSSNHKFYISANNNSNVAIKSKMINLYLLMPKHSKNSLYLHFNK